jgi:phosphatidylserine decarboxylase
MRFAKEGWPFVVPFLAIAAVLFAFGLALSGGLALALGGGVLLFFRDPKRTFSGPAEIVTSAADGLVTRVDRVRDVDLGNQEYLRVVTFLSVFDVHVQRAPIAGTVTKSVPRAGKKLAAYRKEVDTMNQSHLTVLRGRDGQEIGVRQIVGLVARRVVPYLRVGQAVERGGLLGVIKFGSRVDVLMPGHYRPLTKVGERVRCGETPIAESWPATTAAKAQ